MLIISLIRRPKGTNVELDGVFYRFRPEFEGDAESLHVAEVEREDHSAHFLGIPEGYKQYAGDVRVSKDSIIAGLEVRLAEALATVELLNEQVAELQLDLATKPKPKK